MCEDAACSHKRFNASCLVMESSLELRIPCGSRFVCFCISTRLTHFVTHVSMLFVVPSKRTPLLVQRSSVSEICDCSHRTRRTRCPMVDAICCTQFNAFVSRAQICSPDQGCSGTLLVRPLTREKCHACHIHLIIFVSKAPRPSHSS